MMVKKIGDIVLDNKMWVLEEDTSTKVDAKASRTIGGGLVVYELQNRGSAQFVTLDSKNNGWQSEATRDAIIAIADGSLGSTTTITYDDDSVEEVRFAHETRGGAVQFKPIFEGSSWYTAKIYFGKV